MAPFTYDVESVELTNEECAAYAHLVSFLCHKNEQIRVSNALAQMNRPQGTSIQDYLHRQARRMWRTELRI